MTMVGACALAGCGGSDGASTSDGSPAATSDHYTVEAALRDLPPAAGDQPVQVSISDFAEAAELADLPKPADERSTSAWLKGLVAPPLYRPSVDKLGLESLQTGAMRTALGFDGRDVQTYASVESPPKEFRVVGLADGVELKKGVTATGPGDLGDLDLSATDMVFRVVFGVAQQGDQVALTTSAEQLAAWTDRGDSSLANDDAFLDVAKALDAHAVYSAILSDSPATLPVASSAEGLKVTGTGPIQAFNAIGIGQGVEDGKAVEYVAYHLDDATQARDRIEQAWEEGISLRGTPLAQLLDVDEITVKGDVVTVQISPKQSPGLAMEMLSLRDMPFVAAA